MLNSRVLPLVAGLVSLSFGFSSTFAAQRVVESNTSERHRDVMFVPTSQPVADLMMRLANVGPNDVVYDLGCGDGVIVVAAAKRGARVVGVDIDPARIKEATARVRAEGVQDRVTLIRGDIFDPAIRIGDATVVAVYLLQSLNEKLAPRLRGELPPGARVVSHAFTMGNSWPPDTTESIEGTTVYMWTVR